MSDQITVLLLAAVFGTWAILSVLNQLPHSRWFERIKHRDHLALIPSWSFFAPNPGKSDFHLLYRSRSVDGTIGPWRPVDLRGKGGWTSAVWNPRKRKNKALTDAVADLMFLARSYSPESVALTSAYLLLAHHVAEQPYDAEALEFQFVVVESFGFYNPRSWDLVFESLEHRIAS